MPMKDIDLKMTGETVTITATFDNMNESVKFGESCASLIRAAAAGAPEEVQQTAGWLGLKLKKSVSTPSSLLSG